MVSRNTNTAALLLKSAMSRERIATLVQPSILQAAAAAGEGVGGQAVAAGRQWHASFEFKSA